MKSPIVGSRFILIATLVVAACSEAAGPTGVADTQFAKGGKGKTNGKGGELTLITYTVETVPGGYGLTDNTSVNDAVYQHLWAEHSAVVWADYLGCPNAAKDCSAVTLQMTGSAPLSLVPSAVPVVSGCLPEFEICLRDTELQNRRDATVAGGEAMPQIPWDLLAPTVVTNSDDNSWTFTFYWQGQRGRSRTYDTGEQEKVRGRLVPIFETEWHWDTYPDLYPQEKADRFFFHPVFGIGQRTWYHPTFSDAKLLEICDTGRCWAEFRGDPGAGVVTASWTDASVTTDAGQTFLEFSVKATIDSDVNPNPESHGRAMLTHPDGTREMLSYESRWRSGDDAVTSYRVSVGTGCYAIDLVGLIIVEGDKASFVSDNRWVWDGMTPGTLNLGCGS